MALRTTDLITSVNKALNPEQPALEKVVISNELDKLFGSNGCDLGKKIQSKILSEKRLGVIAKELRESFGSDFQREAVKVSGQSAQATLHVIQATEGDKSARLQLTGTDTYNNMPATDLVNSQADSSAFTMDCSGYVSAVLSTEAGITGASAKAAADAAVKNQQSLVIIRASVSSPVALSMNPSTGTVKLPVSKRLDILYAIAVEAKAQFPDATDAMKFTSWRSFRLMWTSNQGNSSLQGKTSLSANAGLGVFSTSVDGSAMMSKGVQFSSFNTYILDDSLGGSVESSLGEIRTMIGELVSQSLPTAPASHMGNDFTAAYMGIPQNICLLPWSATAGDDPGVSLGSIKSSWEKDHCQVTYSPKMANAAGTTLMLAANSGLDPKQTLRFSYPIMKD
jgi:hypothetical protein